MGGPPEIDIVVPSDFVALPAELADDGVEMRGEDRFGSLTPWLIDRALAAAGPCESRCGEACSTS